MVMSAITTDTTLALKLAQKLVERLLQFDLIEDRGERTIDGAVIWHPTETGRELQVEAQVANRVGVNRLADEHIHHLIGQGLIEIDRFGRWKMTELGDVLLQLPGPLLPPTNVICVVH
jgi:hypothetical protein